MTPHLEDCIRGRSRYCKPEDLQIGDVIGVKFVCPASTSSAPRWPTGRFLPVLPSGLNLAIGEGMRRFPDFIPDLQLYVIASMGVALVFEAIRGLL